MVSISKRMRLSASEALEASPAGTFAVFVNQDVEQLPGFGFKRESLTPA
jgi:hypothetical protein